MILKKKGFYFDAHAKSQREKTQLEGIERFIDTFFFAIMRIHV